MRFATLLLASLLVATPAAAHAEGPPPAAAVEPATTWYGWQTLPIDAASIALVATGALANREHANGSLILAGMGTFFVASPAVHLFHGAFLKAGGSLLLRAGMAFLGSVTGVLTWAGSCHQVPVGHDDSETRCSDAAFVAPILVGAGIAAAVDAVFLGRERVRPTSGVSVGLTPTRGGATAGVSGTF